MALRKIGIITGGGDCGGLNAVIKAAALMAYRMGLRAFAIPNGYAGLYNLVDMREIVELTPSRVDEVNVGLAGCEAGHSRVSIIKLAEDDPTVYDRIRAGLEKFGIDALVISGGDDTGAVMVDLHEHGIRCVHAPKTMDLDLMSYSVGADSAVNRIREFVRDLRTTGRSHNRILVVEVFGQRVGHTAFRGGVAAGADAILIPEIPVDFDAVWAHIKQVYFRRVRESDIKAGTYLLVATESIGKPTEEAEKADGVQRKFSGAADHVCHELQRRMDADAEEVEAFMRAEGLFVPRMYEAPEIRSVVPKHLIRCGFTSAYDVKFGHEVGAGAVLCLLQGIDGVTVTGLNAGRVAYIPTAEAIA